MQDNEVFVLPNGDLYGGQFDEVVVVAKKPTIWDKYKWFILGGGGAAVLLLLIVVVCIKKHARKG